MKKRLGHTCKNTRSYEHKKNWNRAVARFRFFVANAKKVFCPSLFFSWVISRRKQVNERVFKGELYEQFMSGYYW